MNDCKSYWICLSKRWQHCVSTKEQKHTGIELIIKNSTEDFQKERKKKKKSSECDLLAYTRVQSTDAGSLELVQTESIGSLGKTAVSSCDLLQG